MKPVPSKPVLRLVDSSVEPTPRAQPERVAQAYGQSLRQPAGRLATPVTPVASQAQNVARPTSSHSSSIAQPFARGSSAVVRAPWNDVTAENLSAHSFATGVGNTDPRWLLAIKASTLLEGGKAAMLRPHNRRELMTLAKFMGLRAFDAGLVIAVVQDGARSGEGALSSGVRTRLTLVGSPQITGASRDTLASRIPGALIAAVILGSMLAYGLISWVTK